MKHTRNAVVGAAALLAAGVVGVGAANQAVAQPQNSGRIVSAQQLKASIQQAIAVESQSTGGGISCCPQGLVSTEPGDY